MLNDIWFIKINKSYLKIQGRSNGLCVDRSVSSINMFFLFTVVGCGLICLAMAYFVSELGAILQVSSISVVSVLIKSSQPHPFVLFLVEKIEKVFISLLYIYLIYFHSSLTFCLAFLEDRCWGYLLLACCAPGETNGY